MKTIPLRLPDDKYARLKALAKHRKLSVNRLIDETATILLTEFEAETRFRQLASQGSPEKGLAVLKLLDQQDRDSMVTS